MKKRLLASVLAICLLVSLLSQAAFAAEGGEAVPGDVPEGAAGGEMMPGDMGIGGDMGGAGGSGFIDVKTEDWYYGSVAWCTENGFLTGTGNNEFSPEDTMTRAMFVTVLARIDGAEVDDSVSVFGDVPAGQWYTGSVTWAAENGIISGYEDGTFRPEDPITREQMCLILIAYAEYYLEKAGLDESLLEEILGEYYDEESFELFPDIEDASSDEMALAVTFCQAFGIVSGFDDGNFYPQRSCTRAQAASVIYKFAEIVNKAGGKIGTDSMGGNDPGEGGGMSFGGSGEVTQGTAANEITEDGTYTGTTYTSTGDDENALRVTGATVTLDGITVSKSAGSSSNSEDGDFYGMNAALLATDGAQVTIVNSVITSSAQNGNGVFSYGEGTVVNISDSSITTSADNSGGIQTTGGGTTIASNLTVETSGSSSAAIRSDRGGGTVTVAGGTYTTNGYNSPAVYSTATITVSDAVLTANNSEALVIEGRNSITLYDCDVSGNMSDTQGTSSDINVHNIMIYQSTSGDAAEGTSEFYMTGGSITSNNGDVIYVTNTDCIIYLSGVTIVNNESDGNILTVAGNNASHGWGTAGANGGYATVTADAQYLEGSITVDTISTLNLTLQNGSEFTGTINIVENEEGGTAVSDNAVITIEEGCTWTLTGDCVISSLTNNGTINFNGYTITLSDGTVLSE